MMCGDPSRDALLLLRGFKLLFILNKAYVNFVNYAPN